MTRQKSIALAFLAGAVLVGGLLGFTADRLVLRDQSRARSYDQRHLRTQLAEDLALSDSQRVAVDAILDRRNERICEVVTPLQPRMDSLMVEARNEIRTLLTAGQRVTFEEKVRKSDERARNDDRSCSRPDR